mmetsp:Transcript_27864/g.78098  ORF Transcript_27864/g.78098 Transcript_27864/m.78098 type:complete len:280 (-) Transcript_27864:386-1225(-)
MFMPTMNGCFTYPSTLRSVLVCSTWLRFMMLSFFSTFSAYTLWVLRSFTKNTFPNDPLPITLMSLKESNLGGDSSLVTGTPAALFAPAEFTTPPAFSIALPKPPPPPPPLPLLPGMPGVPSPATLKFNSKPPPLFLLCCSCICFIAPISACSCSDLPSSVTPMLCASDPTSSTISTSLAIRKKSSSSSIVISSSICLYLSMYRRGSSSPPASASASLCPSSSPTNISSISISSKFCSPLVFPSACPDAPYGCDVDRSDPSGAKLVHGMPSNCGGIMLAA